MAGMSLALSLLALAAAPQPAAPSQREVFYGALRQAQGGRVEQAVASLLQLAGQHPQDSYADDALGQAARLCEEELYRPARALELYRRLLEEYPRSRLARRARTRVEWLSAHLDQGEQVLGEYLRITRSAAKVGLEQAVAAMRKLLDAHPEFSLRAEGRYWIAGLLARTGQDREAERLYQQIAATSEDKQQAARALIDLANLRLAAGNLDGAEDAYRRLGELGPRWRQAAAGGMQQLAHAATRGRIPLVAGVVYALVLLWTWLAFLLGLRRGGPVRARLFLPPVEALVYLVVMAGLIAWAASGTRMTARALGWMAGLHLPLLLPAGWSWKSARPPRGGARLAVRLSLLLVGSLAIMVLALGQAGMIGEVLDTLKFGVSE